MKYWLNDHIAYEYGISNNACVARGPNQLALTDNGIGKFFIILQYKFYEAISYQWYSKIQNVNTYLQFLEKIHLAMAMSHNQDKLIFK